MNSKTRNQALSLAGTAQFALYAHELANDGRDDRERLSAAHHAIFCTDPATVTDVYGNLSGVGDGLAFLKGQLKGTHNDRKAALVARYMGQVLRLSRQLLDNDTVSNQLRGVIDRARLADKAQIDAILDEGYQATISPLKPRILLQGHPSWLENPAIQAHARTHLMAAVRCGVMWRQCGGQLLTLFLRRKALLNVLESLRPVADPSA